METRPESTGALARPWATLSIAAAAVAIYVWSAESWLIFDRGMILHGQVWRVWTGHLVHFSPSHLLWNLAVLVPAGCWLERFWPGAARGYYTVAPLVISSVLLAFDPALLRYAGLSGVAAGVLVLLAIRQLGRPGRAEPAWIWIGVLVQVAAKVGYEYLAGAPLLAGGFQDVRNVPLAHLAGVGCAAAAGVLRRSAS